MTTDANQAGPQGNPGDILNWPMLKIKYPTSQAAASAVLPPGISAPDNPTVTLTVYNFPVNNEPELGVVTAVDADYNGIRGLYSLGYGIDQEAAIFVSQERNGQPKYPATIKMFRMLDHVEAKCEHQGYTFLEFTGNVTEQLPIPENHVENEWWIKVSRQVGMSPEMGYDFPPHVVRVNSTYGTAHLEKVEGTLTLKDSPWDPIKERLPIEGEVTAHLWTPIFLGREISFEGKLDPQEFWAHSDVISGSRWLGSNGGPA
ncbi:MAG: acetoacetate decarboxylase [Myxococcota bacterium]|jgi:acetoacetate decarboxylase